MPEIESKVSAIGESRVSVGTGEDNSEQDLAELNSEVTDFDLEDCTPQSRRSGDARNFQP